MTSPRGMFVVLDGIDGCGKSTQASRLVAALAAAGRPAPLHLREPGGTALGEAIRAVLLGGQAPATVGAEALLFAAARRQMLEELVAPALAAGRDVVCERFHGSTFAYQAVAGGLDERAVLGLLDAWCGEPAPDVEIVLRVDPSSARSRRGVDRDRFEARGLDFQRRVAAGYERYAELRTRVRVVDGTGTVDEVAARIEGALGLARR